MLPPNGTDVLARFLRIAERSPDRIAVAGAGGESTYGRLAAEGNAVRRQLQQGQVAPGSLVGLSVIRSWHVVAGILGIWMHGCAYVPIDPGYPGRRRAYITSDARLTCLVTDHDGGELTTEMLTAEPAAEIPAGAAYVLYTSGSTGDPKGVVVTHRNVAALLDGAATVLPVHPDDVGSVFHSYCFDFSVWEIWRILTTGGRCVFVPAEVTRDPAGFAQLLADSNISLLNIVPSVFANLVRAMGSNPVALPGLREIIFGGEAIDLSTVRAWRRLGLAPRAQLVNMYGITETTVHVTAKRLDSCMPAAGGSRGTPIGLPLPHLQVAVLGADGELAASGSAGEIYVSGAGVSAGYLWRPELTDQRFVHRNFGSGEMRWYRTGDLAVRDENGELSYIGRCDSQVQLRGYRIELGEVEAALRLEPGVFGAGAAVIPNRRGEPTLVGCYVPAGDTDVDTRQLRAAVRERLPGFMVPAVLVPVTELPVTPEGKLDRGVLARELQALTGNNGYPGYWLRPQERSLAGRTPELR